MYKYLRLFDNYIKCTKYINPAIQLYRPCNKNPAVFYWRPIYVIINILSYMSDIGYML